MLSSLLNKVDYLLGRIKTTEDIIIIENVLHLKCT